MKIPVLVALLAVFSMFAGCTSISCKYGPPEPKDELPVDLPVGMTLQANVPLLGLLDESIDDSSIHYLNVVVPPGYRNRFVKQRVNIPAGTKFRIIGYLRPFNPLCYSHDWVLVLGSDTKFTAEGHEINMKFPVARNNELVTR
jgi:hypothetical protein